MNVAVKDDPWSLRLGGSLTAQDFIDKVTLSQNIPAAKPAPKRRARRLGDPLLCGDGAAAKLAAQPGPCTAPKPAAPKRQRLNNNALPAPQPEHGSKPESVSGNEQMRDDFDLFMSHESSALVIGKCFSTRPSSLSKTRRIKKFG